MRIDRKQRVDSTLRSTNHTLALRRDLPSQGRARGGAGGSCYERASCCVMRGAGGTARETASGTAVASAGVRESGFEEHRMDPHMSENRIPVRVACSRVTLTGYAAGDQNACSSGQHSLGADDAKHVGPLVSGGASCVLQMDRDVLGRYMLVNGGDMLRLIGRSRQNLFGGTRPSADNYTSADCSAVNSVVHPTEERIGHFGRSVDWP